MKMNYAFNMENVIKNGDERYWKIYILKIILLDYF